MYLCLESNECSQLIYQCFNANDIAGTDGKVVMSASAVVLSHVSSIPDRGKHDVLVFYHEVNMVLQTLFSNEMCY